MDSPPSSPGRERSHLMALLRREARVPLLKFAALNGVAGLSNSLILALINSAASKVSEELDNARELLLFVVLMAAYVLAQRYVYRASIIEIERILEHLRTRLTDKIRKAEFSQFGRLSRSEIYAGVASEMTSLSQGAPVLVIGLQSSMLILFVTAYMASLSVVACQLTLFLGVLGLYFYLPRAQQARMELRQSQAGENRFIDVLGHILDGFKEVRLHQPRSDDLFEHAKGLSNQSSLTKRNAYTAFSELNVFWQVGFYLLLGFTVFVLPRVVPSYSDAAVQTTASILFLMSPLLGLVSSVPTLSQASVAAENIQKLEAMLDRRDGNESTEEGYAPRTSFQELRLEDVSFSYTDAQGRPTFRLGPANLTLHAGETLFIVGGNGSGKSTLLMLLTGLYRPTSGAILLDGEPVGPYNINSYRSLFATVFSDYHLFDRLYGLRASPERIQEVLRYMELEDKTQVVDGRFKTLGLSSGQRKRLALAVTILEDRPICIFDEWAAEQDPDFRRHFYEDVLADLKKQGKTLIVVSHDDRYFDAKIIDRVVKVERGRFVPFRKDRGADESNDPSAR